MKINGEKGQALPLVMIAVVLGALVVPPFLGYADSSIIGSRHYAGALYSEYACDAGVEDAIWKLTYGGLTNNLTAAGSMVSYTLNESINSLLTNVSICNAWMTIATENFNSGTWTGGTGWTDNWTHTSSTNYAAVTNQGTPYEGSYHLRLQQNGMAKRSVNLSHQSDIHLRFFAKVNSFDYYSNDTVTCRVSSDNVNWDIVHTWTYADSDNTYHYYDIDLSTFEMTSRFWISFNGAMSSTSDHFYVDKIDVIWLIADPVVFAWDYFESGNWSGGGGWTANWTHSGRSSVTWQSSPYEGNYHLLLQGDQNQNNRGDVRRPTNLTDADTPRLRFWAKVNSFESSDNAICQVSSNGTTWTTVYTWTRTDSNNRYRYYDIGLSQFPKTSNFWVRFRCQNCNNENDYLYIDKLEIVNLDMFGIIAKAGDRMIRAIVQFEDGVLTILSWYYV